ncbi:MAG: AarF/ABC1/UbiB kinase family protein [Proteobacteria bacterium]|nr:MAG: AarF/ABC1/UbiB kinase family protein [Pseudomonadota bacterium]
MSLLGAPRQVSRTFKNIGRIKQISTVFAKHGFQELMGKLGFARFIPEKYKKSDAEIKFTAPERLRMALEELGPTFIKLGQLLSSRSDLLPEPYVRELTKLQDAVSPLPYVVIKNTVERELGAPISELFSSFSQTPLASASIGQAHEAVLQDGTRVVVKAQRPGIDTLIKTDVSVLSGLAGAIERYIPETQILAPQILVEEFFQAMSLELDYVLEANNILKSRQNLKDLPEVYIPQVYLDLCTHKVLVMEQLDGVKVDDREGLISRKIDCTSLAETAARAFLKTALEDGFFHGDLHLGNLFAMAPSPESEGKPRLGMIDFGIMGYLTPRARESLVRIFVALSEEDFETLCMEFAELGSSRGSTDFDSFQRNLQASVAPYLGLPLATLNVGKVLIDATAVAAKHQIRIPREWMLIFKALYTLEGTCQKLDPTFNPMPLLQSHVAPLLRPETSWNQFSKDMLLGSRDMQYVAQMLPRQLHWFFKRLAANGYAVEVKNAGAELDRAANEKNFDKLTGAFLFGFCLLGAMAGLHLTHLYGGLGLQLLTGVLFVGAGLLLRKAWR